MNILVLADTHMPRMARGLPAAVLAALPQADLVLHAGDFTHPELLTTLETYAPVIAVAGNNDAPELWERLPRRTTVTAGRFTIGLVHGDGDKGRTFERARAAFAGEAVDCVVFGHSHQPICRWLDDRLYLNPGSPTDKRREPSYSFAWLHTDDELRAELVRFDSKL